MESEFSEENNPITQEYVTETLPLSTPSTKFNLLSVLKSLIPHPKERNNNVEQNTLSNGRVQIFDAACQASRDVFVEKDFEYGSATSSTGVLGAVVEIIGISARLRKLVLKSSDNGASKKAEISAILKDLHNYANIGLIELADDNWSGK